MSSESTRKKGKPTFTETIQVALLAMRATFHKRRRSLSFRLNFRRKPRKNMQNKLGINKSTIDWLRNHSWAAKAQFAEGNFSQLKRRVRKISSMESNFQIFCVSCSLSVGKGSRKVRLLKENSRRF